MAVTGSDQHLTERDCGLNSEQIPRCGAVKKHVRATSRWLSTTAIAVCAMVAMRCSIWVITLIDELHNAATRARCGAAGGEPRGRRLAPLNANHWPTNALGHPDVFERGSKEAMSEIFDADVHQIVIEQHGER
jgi:hypothetical protein